MKYRTIAIMSVAALLIVLGLQFGPVSTPDRVAASAALAANPGIYDYTNHGTAWVAELRSKFSLFKPVGWGTITKVKSAGNQWVHIPVPFPARIADSLVKIKYVEFCAQSTAGANTKPIRMDLWSFTGRFYSTNIAWPANNNKNCFGHEFNPPIYQQDLGVSIQLQFANTTDRITLYKAWVRVTP